jgi:hypothetical protein
MTYVPNPASEYRVKFDFRVDFTNGGHLQGTDFILDLERGQLTEEELKRMIVSSMNLAKAGEVKIYKMNVVHRGEHEDGLYEVKPN